MNIVKSKMGHVPPPQVLHGSYISEKLGRKNISGRNIFTTFAELSSIIAGYFLMLVKYF